MTASASSRGLAVRLFLTCWLVYSLHFATNTVREIYPALSLGDRLSFRVDEYAGLHPDLFEKPGYGWHINANPGVSMVAAVPYALFRPLIDFIVERVNQRRTGTSPPVYDSPWPMARDFYQEAWRRGFDIKFGLAALVMQVFAMAPSSALGVVAMFFLLRHLFGSDRTALWLSLLYAFATPVFFRSGHLNHNLMLGHIAFLGLLALWNPGDSTRLSPRIRFFLGGLAGGAAVLFDYGGVVLLLGLFAYGIARERRGAWYLLGALGPLCLLWFYQWRSFGHPFYPPQHWMPRVAWIDQGYQGFGLPSLGLLARLAFDYRYGLFICSPLMLLALAAPFINRRNPALPRRELAALLAIPAAAWLFHGCVYYSHLQFNTGIRYLAAIFPFLFVPAAVVLARLPRNAVYFIALPAIAMNWCMAMYRDVERGLGVLDPIAHVFLGGFQLPWLTVISRMEGQFGEFVEAGVSALPLFALTAAVLYGLWRKGETGR